MTISTEHTRPFNMADAMMLERASAEAAPSDPMDTLLPCNVTVSQRDARHSAAELALEKRSAGTPEGLVLAAFTMLGWY